MKRVTLVAVIGILALAALLLSITATPPAQAAVPQQQEEDEEAPVVAIEPVIVSISQQVPLTLTISLPDAPDQQVRLPILVNVDLHISLGSTLSATIEMEQVEEPTVEVGEPTATPTPSAVGLRRSNPALMGTPVVSDNLIEITVLGALRGEDAWNAIAEASEWNEAPPAGQEYVLVTLRARNLGDPDEQNSVASWHFQLVGERGITYDVEYLTLGDEMDIDFFGGGTYEGRVAFLVPEGEENLVLLYAPSWDVETRYLALDIFGEFTPVEEPTPAPTPTPTAIADPAVARLAESLLTEDDLPAGWSLDPEATFFEGDLDESFLCSFPMDEAFLAEDTITASVLFEYTEGFGDIVGQITAQMPPGVAEAYMADLRAALEACPQFIEVDDDEEITWTVESLDMPLFGDDSTAFLISGDVGEGFVVQVAWLFIRVEDYLSLLVQTSLFSELDTQQMQLLAATAEELLFDLAAE